MALMHEVTSAFLDVHEDDFFLDLKNDLELSNPTRSGM